MDVRRERELLKLPIHLGSLQIQIQIGLQVVRVLELLELAQYVFGECLIHRVLKVQKTFVIVP